MLNKTRLLLMELKQHIKDVNSAEELQAIHFELTGLLEAINDRFEPTGVPWHEVLKVKPKCRPETAQKAFRKLAKQYHPDQGGDAEKFKALMEAKKESEAHFRRLSA
jgi:DnaJ-domain-containing protein 1